MPVTYTVDSRDLVIFFWILSVAIMAQHRRKMRIS